MLNNRHATASGRGSLGKILRIKLGHKFENIVSIGNLLLAWKEFVSGKRTKPDVAEFSLALMDNIFALHFDLVNSRYRHGGYKAFNISDPKPRNIHKASVRDRLLHHAIYRKLYPFFDRTFIADSFSCRLEKGTYKAPNRFRQFGYEISKNHTRTAWALKCDIKKFFANIDHATLLCSLKSYIPDESIVDLLKKIIESFSSRPAMMHHSAKGLPLGNLTSQLFVNIYMNEFDQFIKHRLKAEYYIRYADDFVILSANRGWLKSLIPRIKEFLLEKLKLELHPGKISIETLATGVDFLGWVHFPDHRVLRTQTKRRMLARLAVSPSPETIASYRGLLRHGNARKLTQLI